MRPLAGVAELVDAPHSKCGELARAGSSPASGTQRPKRLLEGAFSFKSNSTWRVAESLYIDVSYGPSIRAAYFCAKQHGSVKSVACMVLVADARLANGSRIGQELDPLVGYIYR